MSNVPARTRSDRVASLQIDSFSWSAWWHHMLHGRPLLRYLMLLAAILIVTVGMRAWEPPFPYHEKYIPARAIVARVGFEVIDVKRTEFKRNQAAREALAYYENRVQPLVQLRSGVRDMVLRLLPEPGQATDAPLSPDQRKTVAQLLPNGDAVKTDAGNSDAEKSVANNGDSTNGSGTAAGPAASGPLAAVAEADAVAAVRGLLTGDQQIARLDLALLEAFEEIEQTGLLDSLEHSIDQGNQRAIRVFPTGSPGSAVEVEVRRVRIVEVVPTLQDSLRRQMAAAFSGDGSRLLADMIHHFVSTRLPETLYFRQELTAAAQAQRSREVEPVMIQYYPSVSTLVPGGRPLRAADIELLEREHAAWLASRSISERLLRLGAYLGMLIAISLLCGLFIYYQLDRSLLTDSSKLMRLLGLSVACILLTAWASQDSWRVKVLPLVICTLIAAIAYGRSATLMLMSVLSLAIALSLGLDLAEFVIMISVTSTAALMLGRVRDNQELIKVGGWAAMVVFATTIGVGTMVGQVHGIAAEKESLPVVQDELIPPAVIEPSISPRPSLIRQLIGEATLNAGMAILASLLVAGGLVVIEQVFDVQTDMRLLLLGDASHVLLRQLAQRAPGTYNHSITVAAIGEAAADSIGAHGLLVRIGAYFHDIGKIFKPNYYVENQTPGHNTHDALQPGMSTLIIMSHVKDGADLARQHHLPKSFIDLIEQHHGTTLVEYFYRQAAKKNEESGNTSQVSESTFRYPGPKPQSLEAAVLMLSDAVESASRTLVEPTPARLQSLIDNIAMKRLTDGQFDECGLTLTQLNTIKTSLLKSLTAIYHHRIKYDQQSA